MEKGKLSLTNVTQNYIVLDRSVHRLFNHRVGHQIKIVGQDDREFFFDVKRSRKKLRLSQTKEFIDHWNLKEGDKILFKSDAENGFIVNIEKKDKDQKRKDISVSITTPIDEKVKKRLLKTLSETYELVGKKYEKTFNENCYLPTKTVESSLVINGFTERNLTFNFCHTYLKQNDKAIVWQEIPINNVDREHVDSIIIDENWVIYIEAKRLYDIAHFECLLDDLERIKKHHPNIPLPLGSPTNKAIVLLADHYFNGECKRKEDKENYYDKFFNGEKINNLDESSNKNTDLAEKMNAANINSVCTATPTINLQKNKTYNIVINEDIDYTIYCGVYFIDGTEKK